MGSATSAATAGSEARFVVVAADAFGNGASAGLAVAATADGGSVAATVEDLGDGTYGVRYVATVTGACSVAVTLGGAAIAGSPFTVAVGPGAANGTASTAAGVAEAVAGVPATVTVEARDSLGNRRTTGGDAVAAEARGAAGAVAATVVDAGDGSYTLTYTATVSGEYAVHVELGGAAVAASPFNVTVLPGERWPK